MNLDDPTISDLVRNREAWVEATKRNGFATGIADLLAHQYSKKTHFIFELLQNAEDAGAGEVFFDLTLEALRFSHNGTRLFSPADVESITSIGSSTKDYTKIGKHGIGFKAVFAFTHRPRVHSGEMHFEITNVVLPKPFPPDTASEIARQHATRIVLPFDDETIPDEQRFRPLILSETAQTEIGEALKKLNIRTLLFLKNIRVIRWRIEASDVIHELQREENVFIEHDASSSAPQVARVTLRRGEAREEWCVMRRSVEVADDGQNHSAMIEVAYLLVNGLVIKAKDTELVVFFPTEKKTGLGFLVNGPFKTTKARDNISGCGANTFLILAAAKLVADSLEVLVNLGLLKSDGFNALPLKEADFPEDSLFRPVYVAVREALKTKPLIPAVGGNFVSGRDARLAGTNKLTELLSSEQLGRLFNQGPLFWVDPAVSEDFRTYLTGIKVSQYSVEWEQKPLIDGVRVETAAVANRMTAAFFGEQQDSDPSWLLKFYEFLAAHYETFKDVPFVRLESRDFVAPGTPEKPGAYLRPADTSQIKQHIFPLVCESLMVEPAVTLLREKAKLREPDKIEAIIKCLLPKYEPDKFAFDPQSYVADLHEITNAHKDALPGASARLIAALKNAPFIASVPAGSPDSPVVWAKASGAHFELTESLVHWLDGYPKADAWFPHSLVPENLSTQILAALGLASRTLEIQANSHPSWHRSSYHRSEGGFDAMITLLGLEHSLANPTPHRSLLLWNWMLENSGKLKGKERTSPNAQYPAHNTRHFDGFSVAGLLITKGKWLPNTTGDGWHQPHQLGLVDLPDGYEKDTSRAETLSRILGMKQPVDLTPIATALGWTPAQVSELTQRFAGRSFGDVMSSFEDDDDLDLPEQPVTNPALRQERLREHHENAPSNESVLLERSIQPNLSEEKAKARAYLRSFYARDGCVMVCQCCHDRMPFQVQELDYFEAIQCLRGLGKHFYENRLALCPNCAAKYRHTRQTTDTELRSLIISHQAPDTAPSVEIPVTLAGSEWNLHFVGKHWFDLKSLLNV
jgi:hypothetical protein